MTRSSAGPRKSKFHNCICVGTGRTQNCRIGGKGKTVPMYMCRTPCNQDKNGKCRPGEWWNPIQKDLTFDMPEACCSAGAESCSKEWNTVVKARDFPKYASPFGILDMAEAQTATF